jgi:hypothetical protein
MTPSLERRNFSKVNIWERQHYPRNRTLWTGVLNFSNAPIADLWEA